MFPTGPANGLLLHRGEPGVGTAVGISIELNTCRISRATRPRCTSAVAACGNGGESQVAAGGNCADWTESGFAACAAVGRAHSIAALASSGAGNGVDIAAAAQVDRS